MSTAIKIDKGIKIPPRLQNGGAPCKYPWRTMAVGDSFLWPGIPASAYAQCSRAGRDTGRKFTARKIDTVIRVWRIK